MARVKWIADIRVKEVPPRGGRRTIEFEYEYGSSEPKPIGTVDSIIDKIRDTMNRLGFEENEAVELKKILISGF